MTFIGVRLDQWGIVASDLTTGMLNPPFPDNELTWRIERRVGDDVTAMGDWRPLGAYAVDQATGRYVQIRVTMSRQVAPYRPGVRSVSVVVGR